VANSKAVPQGFIKDMLAYGFIRQPRTRNHESESREIAVTYRSEEFPG